MIIYRKLKKLKNTTSLIHMIKMILDCHLMKTNIVNELKRQGETAFIPLIKNSHKENNLNYIVLRIIKEEKFPNKCKILKLRPFFKGCYGCAYSYSHLIGENYIFKKYEGEPMEENLVYLEMDLKYSFVFFRIETYMLGLLKSILSNPDYKV